MEYKPLSKIYYQGREKYDLFCNNRKNGENSRLLNIKIHDNEAFYCLCPEIYKLSMNIMELDKKIQMLRMALPKVALQQFTNKSLTDEIVLTNNIEGVHSTRKEIKQILDSTGVKRKKQRFYGLVKKYKMLSRNKISLNTCEDIRQIYNELVLPEIIADSPDKAPDGKIFRKDLAEVTTATQKVIHQGVFPEEKIIDYMEQALKILNDEDIPALIRISVFHYFFGYIHPFYDGNGRTSRFISSYLLSQNFDFLTGYRLSYTIKENIAEYYNAFKICNDEKNRGDITPFIIIFLDIIHKSFEKLYEALYDRTRLLKENMKKIKTLDCFNEEMKNTLCYCLVQASLFSTDGISKNELCRTLKISTSTLDKKLKVIYNNGYLITNKTGKYNYYNFNIGKLSETN